MKFKVDAYLYIFNFHLSKSKTTYIHSLQAYIDFKFHICDISKSRTSLQAYFGLKFHLSWSRTTVSNILLHISFQFQSQEALGARHRRPSPPSKRGKGGG